MTLELLNQPFLLEKRIELLKAIKQTGSINKAAAIVPMSYKSAWEAVEAMNNLSISPIVTKETGGAGGGGTTLTKYGENLLTTYSLLKEEQRKFIENLNRITDLNSGTLKTIRRLSMQISARNQIIGTIEKISLGAVNAEVVVNIGNEDKIVAIVTINSIENMNLKIGTTVDAIIKASDIMIGK